MMDVRLLPADYLALADIGLPGGRSGLSLLQDFATDDQPDTAGDTFQATGLSDWMGAALDIGGLQPPDNAPPSAV
jgi:hypothetical protein